jgi:hypothetical protein
MWVDVNVSEEDTVSSLTGHFTLLTNTNDQDRKSKHGQVHMKAVEID